MTNQATPGQIAYERFCISEYKESKRIWIACEMLDHDSQAEWEMSAMRWGGDHASDTDQD